MDGPHTSWSFLDKYENHGKEIEIPDMLNVGSLSMSMVHGAYDTGGAKTDWDVDTLL